jgi:hypothetical protein
MNTSGKLGTAIRTAGMVSSASAVNKKHLASQFIGQWWPYMHINAIASAYEGP